MNSFNKNGISSIDMELAHSEEMENLLSNNETDDELIRPNSTSKINRIKYEVEGVKNTMKENMLKVLDRGENLEELQDVSDRLNTIGREFRLSAEQARKRSERDARRLKTIFVFVFITILLIVFVPIIIHYNKAN